MKCSLEQKVLKLIKKNNYHSEVKNEKKYISKHFPQSIAQIDNFYKFGDET
jgi:hypothetical protein